jgi:hypothetical protein
MFAIVSNLSFLFLCIEREDLSFKEEWLWQIFLCSFIESSTPLSTNIVYHNYIKEDKNTITKTIEKKDYIFGEIK